MIEINLIALKDGATRQKQTMAVDIPEMATLGPCIRAGELVFPSGLLPVGRDGMVPAAGQAAAFDSARRPRQGGLLMSYAEAVCKAVGVSTPNVVRAQYFPHRHARVRKQPHPFASVQVPSPVPPSGAVVVSDF